MIRIVRTVHHPDHDRANPTARTVALCQRCQINADRPHHMATAAQARRPDEEGNGPGAAITVDGVQA